tara:strand:+ start:129 stop:374 length:246 start_codon:yes stop_codon:yes gene_type:complete
MSNFLGLRSDPSGFVSQLSERQLPIGLHLDCLIDRAESVARALADNAMDANDPLSAEVGRLWQMQLQRVTNCITDAMEATL